MKPIMTIKIFIRGTDAFGDQYWGITYEGLLVLSILIILSVAAFSVVLNHLTQSLK